MKEQVSKRISFFGKSLLWSLLLYSLTVIVLDWNEIKISLSDGKQALQIVQTKMPVENPINNTKSEIIVTRLKPGV
jgi:hypothetical protein